MYIGETTDYSRRTIEHLRETARHSVQHTHGGVCRGCREHAKYRQHRSAAPHRWITVPIIDCTSMSAPERKRVESQLIRRLRPNLNRADKPFWMMKDVYVAELRRRQRKHKPSGTVAKKGEEDARRPLTCYSICKDGRCEVRYDLRSLLMLGMHVECRVSRGTKDITNWPKLRRDFGDSIVTTHLGEGHTSMTILEHWTCDRNEVTVGITPIQAMRIDTANLTAAIQDVASLADTLPTASDEDLAFYWRVRSTLDKHSRARVRSMIWKECETRFPGLTRQPIKVALPMVKTFDALRARSFIRQLIREHTAWPEFLREWHVRNLRVVTTAPQSVGDILVNVTKPNQIGHTCTCGLICKRLREGGMTNIPLVDGHLFAIGREFRSGFARPLREHAQNVPRPTTLDARRAWERAHTALPPGIATADQWKKLFDRCGKRSKHTRMEAAWITTRDVYQLRKTLHGAVIGPIDKNLGELSVVCPHLYHKALTAAYSTKAGYQRIQPPKYNPRTKSDTTIETLVEKARSTEQPAKPGNDSDVIKVWGRAYKQWGWHKYATFNSKGMFQQPYVLFKAKNIIDPELRQTKGVEKPRPIAPSTQHPMRRLLGLVGRAWSFVAANLDGENFVINHSGAVPAFLRYANAALGHRGQIKYTIKDIDGCYPNMPKMEIRRAMRAVAEQQQRTFGVRTHGSMGTM